MMVVHRPRRVCRSSYGLNKQPLAALAIGGTRPGNAVFVPAPPEELPALLTNFEKYLHAENGLPPLVRIGLAFSSRPSIPTSMVMAASVGCSLHCCSTGNR